MSPPRLPALPCRAPPIVPGMPTSVSNPASPSRTEVEMACPSLAPPPAVTVCLPTVIWLNASAGRRITRPDTPSSRTRMFDPPPNSRTGTPSSRGTAHERLQLFDRVGLGEILGRAHPGETTCAAQAVQPALRNVRSPLPSSCATVPMSPAPMVTSTSPPWSDCCKCSLISPAGAQMDRVGTRGGQPGRQVRGAHWPVFVGRFAGPIHVGHDDFISIVQARRRIRPAGAPAAKPGAAERRTPASVRDTSCRSVASAAVTSVG